MKTQIGGDRLGSSNKQEVSLKNYNRSSHDLGYVWRSSMASGTLVPFMSEVALPGDSFDIDLDCDVKTLPTVGPLFGSYKVQLDIFQCPVRLYQGKLHMNMLNIGMDMAEVKLPQVQVRAFYDEDNRSDNAQINASCILSYLNIRGLGRKQNPVVSGTFSRMFNAVPYLSYWDIYKNYYANKQEERGYVIHNDVTSNKFQIETGEAKISVVASNGSTTVNVFPGPSTVDTDPQGSTSNVITGNIKLKWNSTDTEPNGYPVVDSIKIDIDGGTSVAWPLTDLFGVINVVEGGENDSFVYELECSDYTGPLGSADWSVTQDVENTIPLGQGLPELVEFPLANIDDMRMDILEAVRQTLPFTINNASKPPYSYPLKEEDDYFFCRSSQEGLGIKTYQSDLFNNWISTDWIDGSDGINEITAVSTAGNQFTIDSLNLANKVYNMLNRIAISGGSYDDWLDATYTHERSKSCENPIYHGSLIRELSFQEVVGTAETEVVPGSTQPLGTLAGKGFLTRKDKGGKVKIKVDEPSYIIGLASITPRIDYSQGNKWDVNLRNMNDFHKPALDEIGFQDLITDQMAWFDTYVDAAGNPQYKSAGKQPAWINYMTNVNQCRGSFAETVGNSGEQGSMFMTLNRRYEFGKGDEGITDLTTYIDPNKYNNIFAYSARDSQNFWVQISNRIFARRKMSAKVIPNL